LPRFNLLERSDVEIGHFGEPFLRQAALASLAPEIGSKTSQFGFFSSGGWHASLRRNKSVDGNGATGRNRTFMNSATKDLLQGLPLCALAHA
jgi:hypothetical protein